MKYLLVLFVILFLGVLIVPQRLIQIDSLVCTSQFGMCRGSISGDLNGEIPGSLGEVKNGVKAVLDASSYVSDYSVRFKFPGKLKIEVLEVVPNFALVSGGFYALIDDEGYVVSIDERGDLPHVVIADQVPDVGDKVGVKELFSLRLVRALFETIGIDEISLDKEVLRATLPGGVGVIFPTEGDVDDLVATLDVLVFKLNNGSLDLRIEKVSEIDLRFKNPILR